MVINIYRPLRSVLMGLAASLAALPAIAAADISLKPSALIEGPVVTAGDIFDGAGEAAERTLFRAPAPGKTVELSPGQLKTLATYAGLDWDYRLAPHRYVVRRMSTVIPADRIRDELIFALEDAGATGPLTLSMRGTIQDVHISTDQMDELVYESVQYNPANGHFSAKLRIAPSSAFPKEWTIKGRAFSAMEIPVLNRLVRPGTPITLDDLSWKNVRLDRIPADAATETADIIGMTTVKPMKPGTVIRDRFLRPPLLVRKGETVTLVYQVGSLKLATAVQALKNGAKNQTIPFRNLQSGRTVDAMMSEPGIAVTTSNMMKLAAR